MVYSRKKSLKRRKKQRGSAVNASQARNFRFATPEEVQKSWDDMNFKYLPGLSELPDEFFVSATSGEIVSPNNNNNNNNNNKKRIFTEVEKALKNVHLRPSAKEKDMKRSSMKVYENKLGKRRFATKRSTFAQVIRYLTKKQKNK